MLKAKDLRDKSQEELEAMLLDNQKELFGLKNESKQTKKPVQSGMVKTKRKEIARMMTVIRERALKEESAVETRAKRKSKVQRARGK
jgi:large subunit ribosomal protein L29